MPHRADIVIVLTDNLSWNYITSKGSPDAKPPHMRWLARARMFFLRVSCSSHAVPPSRSAILNGDYP